MSAKRRGSVKDLFVLVLVGAGVLGIVLGGAYYQQDISTYFRLHGWDTGSPERTVRNFVLQAHQKSPQAQDALDLQRFRPMLKNGRLDAVQAPGSRGPVVLRVGQFAPAEKVESTATRVKFKSGVFEVLAKYSDGRWAVFEVDRVHDALKIVSLPAELSSTRPEPKPWD